MNDDLDNLLIGVRADTGGFNRDVTAMRTLLEQSLGAGADKAGRSIETALLRATESGKSGFDSLKTVALSALAEIAAAAIRAGLNAASGSDTGSGDDSASLATALSGLISGAPGRATGGPVSPGRAYLVGERGPELFVPTASGRVEPSTASASSSARNVSIAITVNASANAQPALLAQSSRQVARSVKAALARAG